MKAEAPGVAMEIFPWIWGFRPGQTTVLETIKRK
jgi:hypothetical protein